MLSTLCTPECSKSLTILSSRVSHQCANASFAFGYGDNLTFVDVVSVRQYKYELTCLQDASSKEFCLNVEDSWDISAMSHPQWPRHTAKVYPDPSSGNTTIFFNSTPSINFTTANDQNQAAHQANLAGPDYFINRTQQYSNYGLVDPSEVAAFC